MLFGPLILFFTLFSNIFGSKVVVYYPVEDEVKFREIMAHGLKIPPFLPEASISKLKRSRSFSKFPVQESESLFFRPIKPEGRSMGYILEGSTNYVFNREFRLDNKMDLYLKSCLVLELFKERNAAGESVSSDLPEDKAVIFDPLTAEPIIVDISDTRFCSDQDISSYEDQLLSNRHFSYVAEVPVPRRYISRDELIPFRR